MKVGVEVGEAGEPPESIETTTVGQLVAVFGGQVEPGVPRLNFPRLVAQVGESVKCVRAEEGVDVLNFEVGIVQPENNSLFKVSRRQPRLLVKRTGSWPTCPRSSRRCGHFGRRRRRPTPPRPRGPARRPSSTSRLTAQ